MSKIINPQFKIFIPWGRFHNLGLFWGLNLIQSDRWLSLSLFVKLAPVFDEIKESIQECNIFFILPPQISATPL